MKLISYYKEGKAHYGAIVEGGVVELTKRFPATPDLASLVADPGLVQQAGLQVQSAKADYPVSSLSLIHI